MKKIKTAVLALLLIATAKTIFGQEDKVNAEVRLYGGTVIIGDIIKQTDDTLYMYNKLLGFLSIPIDDIAVAKDISKRIKRIQANRTIFTSNYKMIDPAFMPEPGKVYTGTNFYFLPFLGAGLTKNFSIELASYPFDDLSLFGAFKAGFKLHEKVHIGAKYYHHFFDLYDNVVDLADNFGYGLVTIGSRERNFSIGYSAINETLTTYGDPTFRQGIVLGMRANVGRHALSAEHANYLNWGGISNINFSFLFSWIKLDVGMFLISPADRDLQYREIIGLPHLGATIPLFKI